MKKLDRNTKIDDAGFSNRTRNVLITRSSDTFDIKRIPGEEWNFTLGHLEGYSISALKQLPNLGEKSAQEILEKCKEAGVYLRE